MLILWINEVPDRKADAANGKRTLVVRLGLDARPAPGTALLHVAAFASIVALVLHGPLPWWVARRRPSRSWRAVSRRPRGIGEHVSRAALTRSIEMTIGLQAVGSILLFVGAIFAA